MKKTTSLTIESDTLKRAKETGMNMSEVLENALKEKLKIKTIQITEGDHCDYCGVKMRQATRNDMNGLYWLLPYEKWACPSCDLKFIKETIHGKNY